jgi:cytoskeleton protein RodZ
MNTAYAVNPNGAHVMRAKPDGHSYPAAEAGWFLERERIRRGLSLAEANDATGIAFHHLIALEYGDLSKLPPGHQGLVMVATYGHWLGFDAEPLWEHYATLLPTGPVLVSSQPQAKPVAKLARKPANSFFAKPEAKIIAISLTAMIAIFSATAWKLSSAAPQAEAEMPTASITVAPPTQIASASPTLPLPVAPPASLLQEPSAMEGLGDLITKTVAAVDATGIGPRAEPAPLPGLTMPVVKFTTTENGHRVFGIENTDSRLNLVALGPVTLRVEDFAGKVIASLTLSKGDQYRVPNRDDLSLTARDGSLIAYAVDGRARGTLGQPGDILVGQPLALAELGG